MAERENISFSTPDDFSIIATDTVAASSVANFLNSDPNEISIEEHKDSKETPIEQKKVAEKEKKVSKEVKKEVPPKEEKEEVEQKSAPSHDELLKLLSEGPQEEEETEVGDNEEEGKKEVKEGSQEEKSNIFKTLSQELFDLGVFIRTEEEGSEVEIDNPEAFAQRFQEEKNKQAINYIDNFLSRFGEEYREMFDSVYGEGVHPKDYLERYVKIEDIKNLDLAEESTQERVLREFYKREGRSPEYINSRIEKLKNYGDLEEDAKEAQRILVEKEQDDLKKVSEKKVQENENKKRIKAEYVQSMNNILSSKLKDKDFDGIPVDNKVAGQVYSYLTQDKFKLPDGELITEFDKDILDLKRPENHQLRVKVALLLNLLKSDPTLSKIQKKAVSKETNKLFGRLQAGTKGGNSQGNPFPAKKEEGDVKSWW